MAQKDSNVMPSWIIDVKEDATKTAEWAQLQYHINEAVEQHLLQSHVAYFTDLSNEEKSLLLERAARSLAASDGGHIYENLQAKLSYLLDQSVNNIVAKKMLEDSLLDTKTDLVLDTAADGIITLLKKHPEQKNKLRIFFNQVIPSPIRFLGWQLFFSNANFRKIFINKLSTNPKMCLSSQDLEIQRKCEKILNGDVTFRDLKNSKGNLNSIKGVLSYYHSTLKNKRSLTNSEYYFGVVLVSTHFPSLPKNESPTERSIGILIEVYQQFIQTLPPAILQSLNGYDDNPEMELMIKMVIINLEEHDSALIEYIRNLIRLSSSPGIEDIAFFTTFKTICVPIIKNLFAGYLDLNPLLFIWDQYMISIGINGYHEQLISTFVSIVLIILRDQILVLKSIGQFDDFLINQAYFIQTRQLQTTFNKYFYKDFQSKLNSASVRIGPVIDPTVGTAKLKWEHWHQEVIPRRVVKDKYIDNNDSKLQAEINKRVAAEKKAADEIEKLKRELENLRKKNLNTNNSYQGDQKLLEKKTRNEQNSNLKPKAKSEDKNQQPLLDMLNKMKGSIIKIGHGEGTQKNELNLKSNQDLKHHKLDLKIAEKQTFGHPLNQNEWSELSESEKKAMSEKMLEIVKNRITKRMTEQV